MTELTPGGLSFCGKNVSEIGIEYAPELRETYVYKNSKYSAHEETIEGRDGAYYYGTTVAAKDFNLRFYFENQDIRNGVITKIENYFRRGKTGKLIFNHQPWKEYTATVISCDTSGITNFMNGIVQVVLRAYYPYAVSNIEYLDTMEDITLLNNTALPFVNYYPETNDPLHPTREPAQTCAGQIKTFTDLTQQTAIRFFNPGTEHAKVAVRIKGDTGSGITISNTTTGQKLVFNEMPDVSAYNYDYVKHDGLNGKTYFFGGTDSGKPCFKFHNAGSIELAPAYDDVVVRGALVRRSANAQNRIVSLSDLFTSGMAGHYIVLEKLPTDGTGEDVCLEMAKITQVHSPTLISVDRSFGDHEIGIRKMAMIVSKVNEILITPKDTMDIDEIIFDFKPTYA